MPPEIDRRLLLRSLAAMPFASLAVMGLPLRAQAQAAGLITGNVCLVLPETTEGPFYFDPELMRDDITEGLDGLPLTLRVQVVTASCAPIPGARVDVWHCDARGDYSGYANQGTRNTEGETFLRGAQMTDTQGVVTFRTLWPGWYRGRTTHIHYIVYLPDGSTMTSQIFFDDTISEQIYATQPAYARDNARDMFNADDRIAAQAGEGAYAAVTESGGRYDAALVVGIAA